jgi:hypothetical protein
VLPLEATASFTLKLTEPIEREFFLTLPVLLARVAPGSGRTTARS